MGASESLLATRMSRWGPLACVRRWLATIGCASGPCRTEKLRARVSLRNLCSDVSRSLKSSSPAFSCRVQAWGRRGVGQPECSTITINCAHAINVCLLVAQWDTLVLSGCFRHLLRVAALPIVVNVSNHAWEEDGNDDQIHAEQL